MGRSNYSPPRYIESARELAESSENANALARKLAEMTERHDHLLQTLYRTVDDYSGLLQAHGPYHQVELGEPLSRFENIIRRALNE